jgi:glutamyl-tRNA synthetase/glutamyl-Q tRNA(Asp) synthetase
MRTRFAPAPTGYLHLGHVANAIAVWGVARARGAEVVLRIEDHDRQRCRPEFEAALLEDLDWLGFVPDINPTDAFRRGPTSYRQSDNGPAYEAAVATLRARGHQVYACDCSRTQILARRGGPDAAYASAESGSDLRYDGHCRARGLPVRKGNGLRVQIEPGLEEFQDLRLGPGRQEPALQCGDLLLRDRLGNWTYQHCVVVDDLGQGIDLVIRGEDLLESTGRQVALARMLGRPTPPRYLHHPLICKPDGAKLSKADGDTSLRELRLLGATPGDLREAVGRRLRLDSFFAPW